MEPTAESEFVSTTAPAIFDDLKAILTPLVPRLVVQSDAPRSYTLTTAHIGKNKQPLYFAAVRTNKNYVSFHLVPVYERPVLLQTISLELRARMQKQGVLQLQKTGRQTVWRTCRPCAKML